MKKFVHYVLGIQSPLSFMVRLWAGGDYVGTDSFGNRYYRGKARKHYNHERRWVVYATDNVEASEVPPEYHGWLHHQTDTFPTKDQLSYRKPWQKEYLPNLTGTTLAYRPDGFQGQENKRGKVTGDYEAWTPK